MNDLKVFSNSEFGELGVMLIDGKEYFPATQCAKLIGHENPARAVRKFCKGVTKMVTPTVGGSQEVNYIPEGDLYRLIVNSKLPAAERFERWVFDEVLPSIRQTGGYGNINIEQVIAQTATAVVSEVMKQLIPIIKYDNANFKTGNSRRKVRKYVHYQPSKIDTLSPKIRECVDEMLSSGKYSCQGVANYIINTTGEYISQMAVNRYKHKHFQIADDEQLCFFFSMIVS